MGEPSQSLINQLVKVSLMLDVCQKSRYILGGSRIGQYSKISSWCQVSKWSKTHCYLRVYKRNCFRSCSQLSTHIMATFWVVFHIAQPYINWRLKIIIQYPDIRFNNKPYIYNIHKSPYHPINIICITTIFMGCATV